MEKNKYNMEKLKVLVKEKNFNEKIKKYLKDVSELETFDMRIDTRND